MAKGSPLRLVLIVTGSTLRAEEMDRPLGYYLKQRIEQSLSEAATTGHASLEDYLVRLVADFRWIHDEPLQSLPTASSSGATACLTVVTCCFRFQSCSTLERAAREVKICCSIASTFDSSESMIGK